jgi:hypothetical protein
VTESFGNNGIAFLMRPFSVDAHLDSTRSVRYILSEANSFVLAVDAALESVTVVARVI